MQVKYGKIAQVRNTIRWLKNYQETGYRLCDVTPQMSDKQIQESERKLRADDFNPPENIEGLIGELENIVAEHHEGTTLDVIKYEWKVVRSKLKQIFHEGRILPELLAETIPLNLEH